MKIGLTVKDKVVEAHTCAHEIIGWCQGHAIEVFVDDRSSFSHAYGKKVPVVQLLEESNVVISLGGDGTFLSVARHVGEKSALLMGVNFGTLGFLTEIAPAEVTSIIEHIIKNEFSVLKRELITVEVRRGNEKIFSSQALNDLAMLKGAKDRLPTFTVWIDQIEVMNIRGDGIIVATPTGSTAYSLAAGGAIVHPNLSAILLTPLLPHSLTARPMILNSDSEVEVSFQDYTGALYLTVDGQEDFKIKAGDKVSVTKAPFTARCVRSEAKEYFEILRQKLHWGVQGSG